MPKPREPVVTGFLDDDDDGHSAGEESYLPPAPRSGYGMSAGSCNCAKCMRKAGPVREDTRERIEAICYILAGKYSDELLPSELRSDPLYKPYWDKAKEFMRAVEKDDAARLRELFESLSSDEEMQHEICQNLVISVAQLGHVSCLEVMADYGDPDGSQYDDVGWVDALDNMTKQATALMYACHNGHLPMVRKLLALGADPNATDHGGYSPLIVAMFCDRAGVAEVLLEADAEVNYEDPEGKTALHYAAQYGSSDSIHVLGRAGADPFMQDDEDRTPLDQAELSGGPPVVEAVRKLQHAAKMRDKQAERKAKKVVTQLAEELDEAALRRKEAEADKLFKQLMQEEEERERQEAARKAAKSQKKSQGKQQQQASDKAGGSKASKAGKGREDTASNASSSHDASSSRAAGSAGVSTGAEPSTSSAPAPSQPAAAATKPSRGASPAPAAHASTSARAAGTDSKAGGREADSREQSKVKEKSEEEVLREQWEALLAEANKCTDPALQPRMLQQVSAMLPRVQEAGISVKYGRKVLQKLETLEPARAALRAALAAEPPVAPDLESALALARPAIALIEQELVAGAQAALERAKQLESQARWEKQAQEMQRAAQSRMAALNLAPAAAPAAAAAPAPAPAVVPLKPQAPAANGPVPLVQPGLFGRPVQQPVPVSVPVAAPAMAGQGAFRMQQPGLLHPHLQQHPHAAIPMSRGPPPPLAAAAGGVQPLTGGLGMRAGATAVPAAMPPAGSVLASFLAGNHAPAAAAAAAAGAGRQPGVAVGAQHFAPAAPSVFTPPAFAALLAQQQQQQGPGLQASYAPGLATYTPQTQVPHAISSLWGVPSSALASSAQHAPPAPHAHAQQAYTQSQPAAPAAPAAPAPAAGGSAGELDEAECVVCMERERDVIVMPCFHVCMCAECAEVVKQKHGSCPMCGVEIEDTMEIAS